MYTMHVTQPQEHQEQPHLQVTHFPGVWPHVRGWSESSRTKNLYMYLTPMIEKL